MLPNEIGFLICTDLGTDLGTGCVCKPIPIKRRNFHVSSLKPHSVVLSVGLSKA